MPLEEPGLDLLSLLDIVLVLSVNCYKQFYNKDTQNLPKIHVLPNIIFSSEIPVRGERNLLMQHS